MNAALVPVRSLVGAKKRLANRLTVEQREALALAMLADMIDALSSAQSIDRVVVISSDEELLERATAAGAQVIRESAPSGLNSAVEQAAHILAHEGVTKLLTVPGDVPLLAAAEIDQVLRAATAQHPVVLVPSGTGTGTNGLVLSPPTIIAPHFEGASLAAHRGACADAGIEPILVRARSFELDIDTPDDLDELARLAQSAPHTRAGALAAAAAKTSRSSTRAVS